MKMQRCPSASAVALCSKSPLTTHTRLSLSPAAPLYLVLSIPIRRPIHFSSIDFFLDFFSLLKLLFSFHTRPIACPSFTSVFCFCLSIGMAVAQRITGLMALLAVLSLGTLCVCVCGVCARVV
jgi:hypothetical protein